jgi:hypothetical protein
MTIKYELIGIGMSSCFDCAQHERFGGKNCGGSDAFVAMRASLSQACLLFAGVMLRIHDP